VRQFTSVDAQFIAGEDGCVHGHVVGLAIYDDSESPRGPLTTEGVRDLVASRIHLIPPFRRRMVRVPFDIDLPYWVDDPDFVLDDHIIEHRLLGGDDHELASKVAEIMAAPLDLSSPPWAIHVIHGLRKDRVALATAIHHAASDGIGMAEMFAILHDPTPQPRDLGADDGQHGGRVPSRIEMFALGLAGIPKQPIRFVRSFPRALPHLDQVVTLRTMPGVPSVSRFSRRAARVFDRGDGGLLDEPTVLAPRTRTTGRISAERSVAFATTPLAEIKAIKNHFDVTVNDVVMAIIAGALRTWLLSATPRRQAHSATGSR
jgi:WS/DGAT/MGAT family acyltransferase